MKRPRRGVSGGAGALSDRTDAAGGAAGEAGHSDAGGVLRRESVSGGVRDPGGFLGGAAGGAGRRDGGRRWCGMRGGWRAYCRQYPYNWFNFFDFWGAGSEGADCWIRDSRRLARETPFGAPRVRLCRRGKNIRVFHAGKGLSRSIRRLGGCRHVRGRPVGDARGMPHRRRGHRRRGHRRRGRARCIRTGGVHVGTADEVAGAEKAWGGFVIRRRIILRFSIGR